MPTFIKAIFDLYDASRQDGEDLGATMRRLGAAALVEYLQGRDDTRELVEKTLPAPYIPDHQITFARPA